MLHASYMLHNVWLALPWSCPSIRRRCCAIYFLWLQRWLRRPKSDAHTLLQMWQHRQLAVVMTVACLRVQQSSAAWLDSIMNKSRPALHVSRCVDLSAARDSSWSVGMWHFFSMAFMWSEKRLFWPPCDREPWIQYGVRKMIAWHSDDVAEPSQLSLHDDVLHWVAICSATDLSGCTYGVVSVRT